MSAKLFRYLLPVGTAAVLALLSGDVVGSPVLGMDGFYRRHLDWKPCGIEALDKAGGECADVRVPVDYAEPDGRTMTVAISRVRAADPSRRRGVLLSNPGGPGASGLDSVDLLGDVLSPDVRARYDLIGMDPRGVGRSGRDLRRCGWPVGEMIRSAGLDLSGFLHDVGQAADMAVGCLVGDSAALRQLTTRNTARDMDMVRHLLGERTISYYGVSYGTYLGSVYAQMYPERSDRIVLDSVVDPARYWAGMIQDWGRADEIAFDDWAGWVAARDDRYHLGDAARRVRSTIEGLIRAVAARPIVIDGFSVDDHWLPFVLHNLLANFQLNDAMADVVREVADAAGGPPVTARSPRLRAVLRALRDNENSVQAFIGCGDAGSPKDPAWYWRNIESTRVTQPIFGALANNIQACAFWPRPVEQATTVRNSVPALIVAATGDPRTPYANGIGLHRAMPASRLVTLRDVRIHMTFRPDLSSCVNNAINTYFIVGTVPATETTCYADRPAG